LPVNEGKGLRIVSFIKKSKDRVGYNQILK